MGANACGNPKCKNVIRLIAKKEMFTCLKCSDDLQYCSDICMRKEWFVTHQFECKNNNQEMGEDNMTPTPR